MTLPFCVLLLFARHTEFGQPGSDSVNRALSVVWPEFGLIDHALVAAFQRQSYGALCRARGHGTAFRTGVKFLNNSAYDEIGKFQVLEIGSVHQLVAVMIHLSATT